MSFDQSNILREIWKDNKESLKAVHAIQEQLKELTDFLLGEKDESGSLPQIGRGESIRLNTTWTTSQSKPYLLYAKEEEATAEDVDNAKSQKIPGLWARPDEATGKLILFKDTRQYPEDQRMEKEAIQR